MKLWHLIFVVFLAALSMAVARDPVGRVALVVFVTSLSMIALGTASLLLLFRAISAIGSAESTYSYIEACAATAGVLVFGSSSMLFVLWCGVGLVTRVAR
jgi:hypothetical protein